LSEDIGETTDLSEAHHKIVADLHATLASWREQIEAKIPQPNPDWAG